MLSVLPQASKSRLAVVVQGYDTILPLLKLYSEHIWTDRDPGSSPGDSTVFNFLL